MLHLRFVATVAQLRGPEMVVGRSIYSSIVLPHSTVSRLHARINQDEGGYAVSDLGSRNGTFVNGVAVGERPVPFVEGDELQFGDVRAKVEVAQGTVMRSSTTDRPSCPDDDFGDTTATMGALDPEAG